MTNWPGNTLVGEPKGKIPLGRHRSRLEDNIKIVLKKNYVASLCTGFI
jgi:hypothetical protein